VIKVDQEGVCVPGWVGAYLDGEVWVRGGIVEAAGGVGQRARSEGPCYGAIIRLAAARIQVT
jgi:hypothetical protein